MKPVEVPGERIASAGAAALGLANVAYQAALTYRPTPDAVLAVAGALAPTLAILVAWWAPGRALRLSMLVVAMLLELPALVIAGSALALGTRNGNGWVASAFKRTKFCGAVWVRAPETL